MNTRMIVAIMIIGLGAAKAIAQDRVEPRHSTAGDGHPPPSQAYEDCRGKQAGDAVQHRTPDGIVPATCQDSPQGLVARPTQRPAHGPLQDQRPGGAPEGSTLGPSGGRPPDGERHSRYSIEQAISDQAQLHTIAFNGLAFLTGDFGRDTFLPPGKVSDYFGFQYMRDVDAKEGGHNTSFLTRIAYNLLAVLNAEQRDQLLALAKAQQADIADFARMRLPLIQAFRRNLEGNPPPGSKGLDRTAVVRWSADLYQLDGRLAFQRAQVMGRVLRSLSAEQRAALAKLKFGDSGTWPDVPEPIDRWGLSHNVHVAVMTYASEMFSWYAGSLEADTYFCPERHGMYFGGFGMKTAPAMGKKDYSVSTSLTGNRGEDFLATLTESQGRRLTHLVREQRPLLEEIVTIRRAIVSELRRLQRDDSADQARVLALSRRYGELDGELSYRYAETFAAIRQTLTADQQRALVKLRSPGAEEEPKGPFLYSDPVAGLQVPNSDFLFGVGARS